MFWLQVLEIVFALSLLRRVCKITTHSPISGSRLKCRVHSLTHLHAYRLVSHFITLWFNRIYLIERLASHFHSHSWSKAWARNSSSIYSHHRLAREWRKIYCNWKAEGRLNDTAKISWRDRSRNRRNKVEVGWLSKKRFVSKHQLSFLRKELSCCTIIEQQPQNKAANGSANAETFSLAKEVKSLRLLA